MALPQNLVRYIYSKLSRSRNIKCAKYRASLQCQERSRKIIRGAGLVANARLLKRKHITFLRCKADSYCIAVVMASDLRVFGWQVINPDSSLEGTPDVTAVA